MIDENLVEAQVMIFVISCMMNMMKISHIGAIKLTEAEWKDYQRVEEEYQAWQERIEALTGPPSGLASPNLSRSVIEWLIEVTEASLEVGLLDERQRPPVKRK